jgi:hypothetical protein
MGLQDDRFLRRVLNVACGARRFEPLRRRVCEGLAGDVFEIGSGSGLNVPFYPAAITRVAAVEPADVSWRLAGDRLMQTRVPVQRPAWTASRCPTRTTADTDQESGHPSVPPGSHVVRCRTMDYPGHPLGQDRLGHLGSGPGTRCPQTGTCCATEAPLFSAELTRRPAMTATEKRMSALMPCRGPSSGAAWPNRPSSTWMTTSARIVPAHL